MYLASAIKYQTAMTSIDLGNLALGQFCLAVVPKMAMHDFGDTMVK
jgi:hypothetical protein